MADGSAAEVLTWSERFRAGSLQLAPTPPGHDPAVLRDLAELRRLATEIESAALAGVDIAPLRRRQVALEAAVNRLVRTVQGRASAFTRSLSVAELVHGLGERTLVELADVDRCLYAVVVGGTGRRPVLTSLGPTARVLTELDAARFAVRRLAFGRGSPAALAAARVALAESAKQLDSLLLAPIAAAAGDGPLVIVPTGALHVLPWSTLPSLQGRPVSIAPSAALWLDSHRAEPARSRRRRVALVAGPGLPGPSRGGQPGPRLPRHGSGSRTGAAHGPAGHGRGGEVGDRWRHAGPRRRPRTVPGRQPVVLCAGDGGRAVDRPRSRVDATVPRDAGAVGVRFRTVGRAAGRRAAGPARPACSPWAPARWWPASFPFPTTPPAP